MSPFIPSLAQCFQPRFNFHSKIGERLLEVVPLSQLLFVCFARVLVSLCALSVPLLLSFAHLRLCWRRRCRRCSLLLCLSLSLFQTLNLLRTVAQIAQTRNLEMALPICDCNCDCKVNFCVHLRLQNALPKKAANSPGQATHVAGSRQRHATSGR